MARKSGYINPGDLQSLKNGYRRVRFYRANALDNTPEFCEQFIYNWNGAPNELRRFQRLQHTEWRLAERAMQEYGDRPNHKRACESVRNDDT